MFISTELSALLKALIVCPWRFTMIIEVMAEDALTVTVPGVMTSATGSPAFMASIPEVAAFLI